MVRADNQEQTGPRQRDSRYRGSHFHFRELYQSPALHAVNRLSI
jgi:hypothetical protein